MGGMVKLNYAKPTVPGKTEEEQVTDVIANTTLTTKDGKSLGTLVSIINEDVKRKPKSVKQMAMENAELRQKAEIDEYRKKLNFPAEVTSTSIIRLGSSRGKPTAEEITTSNKNKTYDKAGKRGTRLVRSV